VADRPQQCDASDRDGGGRAVATMLTAVKVIIVL
jgi:hypothetical protein